MRARLHEMRGRWYCHLPVMDPAVSQGVGCGTTSSREPETLMRLGEIRYVVIPPTVDRPATCKARLWCNLAAEEQETWGRAPLSMTWLISAVGWQAAMELLHPFQRRLPLRLRRRSRHQHQQNPRPRPRRPRRLAHLQVEIVRKGADSRGLHRSQREEVHPQETPVTQPPMNADTRRYHNVIPAKAGIQT